MTKITPTSGSLLGATRLTIYGEGKLQTAISILSAMVITYCTFIREREREREREKELAIRGETLLSKIPY